MNARRFDYVNGCPVCHAPTGDPQCDCADREPDDVPPMTVAEYVAWCANEDAS